MKFERIIWIAFFMATCIQYSIAQKQKSDSTYVQPFPKENVVELYPGIYSSEYIFKSQRVRSNFKLVANSSAYMGAYFEYKWLAFNLSTAIPGTQLDRNIRFRYNSVNFRFGGTQFMFKPFYNSYNGLLLPERKRGREFLPFKDIQISNAGADVFYYANGKTFSYGASNFFSKKQLKSQGTFIAALTPMWQEIKWKTPSRDLIEDSATYTLLESEPQWFSLTARLGYTYNFVFHKGKWSIAPTVLLGVGGLHEIKTQRQSLQSVSDVQGYVNAGYNGEKYYFYFTAWWDNIKTNLFVKELEQRNSDISITFGYRFRNLKKRIIGIL